MSAKTQEPTMTGKECAEVLKDISKIKEYLKKLERAGAEPPKDLKTAIIRFEAATKSGKDVAEAADEANEELKRHADNMKNDCAIQTLHNLRKHACRLVPVKVLVRFCGILALDDDCR